MGSYDDDVETFELLDFIRRHPGLDWNLLMGFVRKYQNNLYRYGVILWTEDTPPVLHVNEKRFFNHIMRTWTDEASQSKDIGTFYPKRYSFFDYSDILKIKP